MHVDLIDNLLFNPKRQSVRSQPSYFTKLYLSCNSTSWVIFFSLSYISFTVVQGSIMFVVEKPSYHTPTLTNHSLYFLDLEYGRSFLRSLSFCQRQQKVRRMRPKKIVGLIQHYIRKRQSSGCLIPHISINFHKPWQADYKTKNVTKLNCLVFTKNHRTYSL